MDKLLNIIQSADFWRGVTYILTALGVKLAPDQMATIVSGGLMISGLLHTWETTKKKP